MKKYINIKIKSIFLNLIMLIFFTSAISELQAQESKNTDNFKIVAEMKDSKIIFNCESGCDWKKLTYRFSNGNKSQAINAFGISDETTNLKNKNSNYSNFVFVISKTSTGINLIGIEGLEWEELDIKISNNQKQTITKYGLAH